MQLKLKEIFVLARPHQYIKNFFIFMPLFFDKKITEPGLLSNTFLSFIAFSLTASAVYILNDYCDIEDDRHHPTKKNRPLASGAVRKLDAIIIMAVLLVTGILLMVFLSFNATEILAIYVFINIAYSLYIKHIAILDVTVIAIGFVLRIFIGSAMTGISLSMWIVIMTFLLALFLALAKRRDDVLIYMDSGKKRRKVIDGYNLVFLDIAMGIMAAVVIVAYIIYTTSPEVITRVYNKHLYLTALFVIIGIMRYLQIVFIFKNSSSPTMVVLKDRFMQLTLTGWIVSFAWILYL